MRWSSENEEEWCSCSRGSKSVLFPTGRCAPPPPAGGVTGPRGGPAGFVVAFAVRDACCPVCSHRLLPVLPVHECPGARACCDSMVGDCAPVCLWYQPVSRILARCMFGLLLFLPVISICVFYVCVYTT